MPHALYGDGPSKIIALHGWRGDRHAFDALPSLDQRAFTFEIPDIRGYGNLKQQPAKQICPATPAGALLYNPY
jgi:esterase/lipase